MIIGLIDLEVIEDRGKCIPSIDLMKLSTYYKKNKHFVIMIKNLTFFDNFDIIYVYKSLEKTNCPDYFFKNSKYKFLGKGFLGSPKSILPKEVEKCEGDISIYLPFFEKRGGKWISYKKTRLINSLQQRFSQNGEILNQNLITFHPRISLYDNNILEKNIYRKLPEYIKTKEINFIYPQYINSIDILKDIKRYVGKTSGLIYNGNDKDFTLKNSYLFNDVYFLKEVNINTTKELVNILLNCIDFYVKICKFNVNSGIFIVNKGSLSPGTIYKITSVFNSFVKSKNNLDLIKNIYYEMPSYKMTKNEFEKTLRFMKIIEEVKNAKLFRT